MFYHFSHLDGLSVVDTIDEKAKRVETLSQTLPNRDSFLGCFFGLALGDALCAPYEGGILERLVWQLISKSREGKTRYTDDTQMSLDVALSLLTQNGIDQNHLAQTFASSYRWSRGYGSAAAKILKKIKKGIPWYEVNRSVYPQGSFGNGAAMRAPIVALYHCGDEEQIANTTEEVSLITHAHPLAIEGAKLIALATSIALAQRDFADLWDRLMTESRLEPYQIRIARAKSWIESGEEIPSKRVAKELGNGIAATDSCTTAIYIASRFIDLPFDDMLLFIQNSSGDTDTIAAMAGAIWGAYNGVNSLPRSKIEQLESRSTIEEFSIELYAHFQKER
ncbi:MAG: ADP-ribosylglycohydrolase family protein [Campylobacterota bacterium]|nr:ADP-ribosylglycohydrolase family protein [Campylobacterota bacterium]